MINFFKNFNKDESGAVTVDFVVLTAAVVALAVVAFGSIRTATTDLASGTAGSIESFNPDAGTGGETPIVE